MTSASDDFDMPDEEERRVISRRLFTYSAKALALASAVDKVFVNHPHFKASLEGLDRVFQLSRELSVQQGLAIIGPTGAGKTALIRYFRNSLPKSSLFEVGLGALAVRIPKKPNVGHLVGALLRQLRYPFPQVNANTLSIKRTVLVEALRQKGTRLLFVDEAHHLRSQCRMRSRHEDGTTVTDCLRELMDEVPVGLALCGAMELEDLVSIDEHLNSRVSARFKLLPFENGALWHGFIRTFKKQCTVFNLEVLDDRHEAARLHTATGGNLREFKRLITEAVLVATDAGAPAIALGHLAVAFDRVHGGANHVANPYAS